MTTIVEYYIHCRVVVSVVGVVVDVACVPLISCAVDTMSKVDIMNLFKKARDEPAPSSALSLPLQTPDDAVLVKCNERTFVPDGDVTVNLHSSTDGELPDFLSDSSTLCQFGLDTALVGTVHSRLVAAGGQYLCMARGPSLWVLDMTTGKSNNPESGVNIRPITDLHFNASSSLLVFTDGIDVGVVKCAGVNGDYIQLNAAAYLKDVGSVDDPVVTVSWHPTNTPSFASIRQHSGWTLWDLVRLQSRAVLAQHAEGVPSLFNAAVVDSAFVAEGVFKWAQPSDVFAGKKLSPGVLAILKRGDASPEKPLETSSVRKYNSFAFSADGSLAVASVGDVLKVWSLRNRCAVVTPVSDRQSEDRIKSVLNGKSVVGLTPLGGTRFGLLTENKCVLMELSETSPVTIHRRIEFGGVQLEHIAQFPIIRRDGVRESVMLLVGWPKSTTTGTTPVMILVESDAVTSIPIVSGITSAVLAVAVAPSVGNPRQFAVYMNGVGSDSLVWTAQTLDSEMMVFGEGDASPHDRIASDLVEASPLVDGQQASVSDAGADDSGHEDVSVGMMDDDFPHSDVSDSPPERLQSTVDFSNHSNGAASAAAFAQFADSVREGQQAVIAELSARVHRMIDSEVNRVVRDKSARFERDCQTAMEKESQRVDKAVTDAIKRTVKDQFASGMRRMMTEIGAQLESRLTKRMDALAETVRRSNGSNVALNKKLDELIARVGAEVERLKAEPEGPAGLGEIRRFINAGDHIQAISTAAQWWKLNQPVTNEDLLAITCAAIAPQIRPGEPMKDVSSGCYILLVLTEWTKVNSALPHADRTVAVLRAAKFVLSCLFVSPITVSGETQELCHKSLSKSIRNAAAILGTADRTVEELSREVLGEIRELMMRFSASRVSTPRSSVTPVHQSNGHNILHLLQSGRR